MADLSEPAVCRFDDFMLDRETGTLSRVHPDGRSTSIPLGSRALQILCLLVDRRGEIVSSREIMDVVWRNLTVEPNNLTVQLTSLRRILDATRLQGSCIQNVPGRGYRFIPEVTDISPLLRDPPAMARVDAAQAVSDASPDPAPPVTITAAARPWRRHIAWVAAASLCIAAALTAVAWYTSLTSPSQTEATTAPTWTTPVTMPPVERPRLSLVVLPFSNLGGDGLSDDSVEAVTDDLTTDLSRWPDVLVIARNSAFTYQGKPIDIRRVGAELGVRYAAEGSVRKIDGALRINVQLVDTDTGASLWRERFDVRRDGIGHSVDDIVREIAFVLNWSIVDAEAARSLRERPDSPEVADLLLRARSIYARPPTPQRQAELVPLYERAAKLDPNSAAALAGLAEALLDSANPYADDPTVPEQLRRAEELLQRAEQLRPRDMWVMWVRVLLLGQQDRCAEVFPAAQRAVDAHPILTGPRQWQAICLIRMGRPAEAIPPLEQAIRINPRNSNNNNRYRLMGYAMLFLERYDEAVHWFQKSLAANPGDSAWFRGSIYASMAAAQALAGHAADARASAMEAKQINPTLTARRHFPFKVWGTDVVAQVSRMRDGMRLAGVRDHAEEDADFELPSDDVLHTNYEAPTPTTVPGAQTVRTADLAALLRQRNALVIDTIHWGRSIPGAVGLWGAGVGGTVSDEFQERLARKMQQLTGGDRTMPIVAMGFNSERYAGRNLTLRLVALGYTEVYWYRGGREAWQVAGLPDADLILQDW